MSATDCQESGFVSDDVDAGQAAPAAEVGPSTHEIAPFPGAPKLEQVETLMALSELQLASPMEHEMGVLPHVPMGEPQVQGVQEAAPAGPER